MEKTLPQVRKARLQPIDRSREMAWIENNRSRYAGQWVALDGDRLIACGNDPLVFKEKARSEGVERPFTAPRRAGQEAVDSDTLLPVHQAQDHALERLRGHGPR